jgi:hypothetical protein
MLEMVAELVQKSPTLLVVVGLVLLAQTFWMALFAITTVQVLGLDYYGFGLVYLLFAAFWTTQVFKHVVHAVVAGTICHGYFQVPHDGTTNVTLDCFQRALTSSFGSICYGSLFVLPCRVLMAVTRPFYALASACGCVRSSGGGGGGDNACARAFMCIEGSYHNFNRFAFSQMIMFGKDFRSAALHTWDLFFQRAIDNVLEADKVGSFLFFPCIGAGCIVSTITALWARAADLDNWFVIALVLFWVGFVTVQLTTEIMEGAVVTIFSCFADDPRYLSRTSTASFFAPSFDIVIISCAHCPPPLTQTHTHYLNHRPNDCAATHSHCRVFANVARRRLAVGGTLRVGIVVATLLRQ